ncbi:MAG: hypothetical protein PWP23_1853 [Candidatus Sumerlaeota bacterium]|nr:hypothetical protein [Candidatus Sumerlaeota bacterium]
MKTRARHLIGLLLATALLGTAAADVLILTSGARREGRVEDIVGEPDKILLVSGSQQIRIPRTLVQEVVQQSDAEDYTILGDQFIAMQSYERAIRMFQRALEANPNHQPANDGLQRARSMIGERQAEAQRQADADNADRLSLVRSQLENDESIDFVNAEKLLDTVVQTSNSDDQKAAAELLKRDLYLEWARDREDKLDPTGAQEYLQKVLAIDKDNKEAEELLLKVWQNDPNRREQVAEMLKSRLADAPDDLILNQKYADVLLSMNRDEEAIEPLLKLHESGRFRALDYDARLERALTEAAEKRSRSGENEAAIALYKQALSLFPDYDPSALYRLEYRQRLDAIDPTDWEARAALLDNLMAQGMTRLALDEAQMIVQNDPENAKALGLLRRAAEEELFEATQAFAKGQYTLAKSLSRRFATENTRFPDLVQAASDIYNKANIEAEREQKRLRERARELVSYGDENLALARRNLELYKSAEITTRTGILPYKFEAQKFAERAIEAYNEAKRIDPTVAQLVDGLDVNTKIRDAEDIKNQINRATPRILLPQGTNR